MSILSDSKPGKSGVASNVVFVWEDLPAGSSVQERLEEFARARYREMEDNLPSPIFHVFRAVIVEERPAHEIIVSWLNGTARISQWLVFMAASDDKVLSGTATAGESDYNDASPVFAELFRQAARQL